MTLPVIPPNSLSEFFAKTFSHIQSLEDRISALEHGSASAIPDTTPSVTPSPESTSTPAEKPTVATSPESVSEAQPEESEHGAV